MLDILWARLQQKHRTIKFPDAPPPALPDRYRGRPAFSQTGAIKLATCARESAQPGLSF